MTVLRIDSSPRNRDSNSRTLGDYLLQQLKPEELLHRDLAQDPFPTISPEDLIALHSSKDNGSDTFQMHLAISDELISELERADTLVIDLAMHNFTVPAALKRWIDYVARAGRTFRYTEDGPIGLTNVRRAYIVVATGGTPVGGDMDFASNYMAHICRFIGVEEVHIIDAGGSKRTPEQVIEKGQSQIDNILTNRNAA